MPENRARVRRLLEDELEECCGTDIDRRLATLDSLRERSTRGLDGDVALLATLGNDTRLRLLRALDAADDPLCVCELEVLADVSESAVSHALSDLVDVGLVSREKRGKWRYYEPTDTATALLRTLDLTREQPQPAEDGGIDR